MKTRRKMIEIDETLCNGCGECITDCPEGALQIVETPDGPKARVVKESFCDGLGACMGACPTGALRLEEKEVDAYDEDGVIDHLKKNRPEVLEQHLEHLRGHGHGHATPQGGHAGHRHAGAACGCPGASAMAWDDAPAAPARTAVRLRSELRQWPVQLHLLSPTAPYLRDADLVLAADCVPFAFADFHREFLRGRALAIACPKLDDPTGYVEKLTAMIDQGGIRSITVLHMEVPCCGGLIRMAQQAIAAAHRKVPLETQVITIRGEAA